MLLKRIDVSHNQITAVREVERLAPLTVLMKISLEGNPITNYEHYRARVSMASVVVNG